MVAKYWVGGKSGDTTNYANDENWQPVSIRNTTLAWTASGSGTSEYYLRTSGGANPATGALAGLVEPSAVYESGTALTAGTAGSLAAGTWDWGDNDSLGYSTIYVRTSGSVDPDSLALDAITFTDTPKANDDVYIGPKLVSGSNVSYDIASGLDASNIELDNFIVQPTYTGKIGSSAGPLKIDMGDSDVFEYAGRGTAYIDVGTAAISPTVVNTASATTGQSGLYLTGSAIATIDLRGGSLQLDGATVTTAQVLSNASLSVRYDSTVTTTHNSGTLTFYGTGVTINSLEGVTTVYGSDALAVNIHGGVVYNEGTGTMTAVLYESGTLVADRDGRSKSITLTQNGGTARIGSNVTLTATLNTSVVITA